MALFKGDLGVIGMATDSLLAPFPMYPKPTSPGWAWANSVFSENGSFLGSMGEWTAVASANRGVLSGLASDEDVDDEFAVDIELADMVRMGVRFRANGRFFSSRPMVGGEAVAWYFRRVYITMSKGIPKEETSLHFKYRC